MKANSIVCLSFASLVFWTGCSEETPPVDDPCGTFNTTLAVHDRMNQPVAIFNAGEDVVFSLAITNTTSGLATLTAGSSCTAVVFELFDAANQRLWGSADAINCIAMLQPRTYQPHESVEYTVRWRMALYQNVPLPPSPLTVTANVGQFMTDAEGRQHECRSALSKSAKFTLQ